MNRFRLCTTLLLGAAILAGAQETPDVPVLNVTVTASRTPEDSASVSGQVQVITAEDIAASGAVSVVELLQRVPGLHFTTAMSGAGSEQVSMRGFGESSFGRVLVLVDGKRLNNADMQGINWNSLALSQIERIEVLDGTASVEYGNNAVAGVINIITKKDPLRATSRIAASLGSFFTNRQYLSHEEATRWGSFSFNGEHWGTEGFRDRQASETSNLGIGATVNLGDTMSAQFRTSMSDLSYQLPGSLTRAEFEGDPSQAAAAYWADEGRERDFSAGLGIQWIPSEQLQFEVPLDYTAKYISNDTASWASFTDRVKRSGELRPKLTAMLSLGALPLRLVGGLDLYGSRIQLDSYGEVQRTTKTNTASYWQLTGGTYLSAKLDILKNLFVDGGLRYDGAFIGAKSQTDAVDTSVYHSALVYDGGLTYRPWEQLKLYATYSTLFRYPFVDEQAELLFGTPYFNSNLKPEQGYNAEAGLALYWKDLVSLQGNLYVMELRDEIAFNPLTFHNENLDSTRRIGSNISLGLTLLSFLDLTGTYGYVVATFTEGSYTDNTVPLVPVHSLTGELSLRIPGNVRVSGNAEYRSEAYQGGDQANSLDMIEAYTVYGAQVRWSLDHDDRRLEIQGIVKNLLDASYAPLVYYGGYYPADGRSFSLLVSYQY